MQVVALIDEDGGRYGVSFPDFPGATTMAKSPDEAIAKAAEVLAFHVEGLAEDGPLPEPRTLSQLRADPAFRSEAKNAIMALIPYTPPSKVVRVNMTFDERLLARVDAAAQASGETRSAYFAAAVTTRLYNSTPEGRRHKLLGKSQKRFARK